MNSWRMFVTQKENEDPRGLVYKIPVCKLAVKQVMKNLNVAGRTITRVEGNEEEPGFLYISKSLGKHEAKPPSLELSLEIWAALNEVLRADEGEVSSVIAQRWNARVEETGDTRVNPPINGIVRHDSHMQKSTSEPDGNRTRLTLVGGKWYDHSIAVDLVFYSKFSSKFPLTSQLPAGIRVTAPSWLLVRCDENVGLLISRWWGRHRNSKVIASWVGERGMTKRGPATSPLKAILHDTRFRSIPALVPDQSHCSFRAEGTPRGCYMKRVDEETDKEASILILRP
ncbi:hypothetical protein PR048_023111 [Dryococelus australis]|uniref:Uncharacterized protein n=1 Tax=Dryococelus australis TaxID=614101 RepID=A0ABQ9GT57_9NEOP|nr:hypothetical protein PR048_023111 [Dryococelus australis]